ncbi:hypothetical protein PYCCODRAFT_1479499 [Trametes coccinea BRFM310]|uniref:DUF6534 domain-containing protein n=1 Tax=Trametes coccinea (strain BRFM310) TaxID=1353009 RepID=A0A1Y2IGU1_TRAC3|nr:hypothetical protein PYCCODRAFT_1479499 [Trametes coccinea BRFM310]
MLVQQTFRYFRLYPSDPLFMKLWVILALVLQSLTVALIMHTSYYYLVTYYLNTAVFSKPDVWTSGIVPFFASTSNVVCESFFARRVFMIGRRYRIIVLSAMIMIIVSWGGFVNCIRMAELELPLMDGLLSGSGFYLAVPVQVFKGKLTFENLNSTSRSGEWTPTVGSALLLAGDVQLTAVLVYVLHRGRSGIRRTDSMVDVLIAYAVTSGTLICILNLLSVILFCAFPHSIIYAACTLVTQAVYTNSFVVALNTRLVVRSRGELDDTFLDTGIVLGERASSGTAVNQVELPLASMVFARAPIQTQVTEAVRRDSDVDSSVIQDETPKAAGGFDEACLPVSQSSRLDKHTENVLPIV